MSLSRPQRRTPPVLLRWWSNVPFLKVADSNAKFVNVGLGSSAIGARRVMLGTGTEAIEVWPGYKDVSMDFNFNSQDELKWAPITGFDNRTAAASTRTPGFTFSGMFVAGDNPAPSFHYRLVNHRFDGAVLDMTVTMGDIMNIAAKPSTLILAANAAGTEFIMADFGSTGVLVYSQVGTTRTYLGGSTSTSFAAGDRLRVLWQGASIEFFKNESTTRFQLVTLNTTVQNQFKDKSRRLVGFGLHSDSGLWSTRIQRVFIAGKSSETPFVGASEALAQKEIGRDVWTNLCTSVVPHGGFTNVSLIGGSWAGTNTNNRLFRILKNGTELSRTTNNAGSLSLNSTLVANDVIAVEGYVAGGTARTVNGGVLRIGDPSIYL